jgi:hypothetical protein
MKTNEINDAVYDYLITKHSRVYKNNPVQQPAFPYVVFFIDSVNNSMPSDDLYLNINIYEDPKKSIRAIETLGDEIDGDRLTPTGLNMMVINTSDVALRFFREQRQRVGADDLISSQMVNIRYVLRAYYK